MPATPPEAPSATETELKLVVPHDALAGVVSAMRQGRVRRQRLQAVYLDTADERLAAHGIALRLRREGADWVQTAKAMTPDALRRLEHNVRRGAAPAGRHPAPDLGLHDGTPVGEALRAALAGLPGAALVERYRTDVSRLTRQVQLGNTTVELALDTGAITAGKRSVTVCELEFELVSGPVAALPVLASGWVGAHGLWLSTVSKSEQGQRLLHAAPQGPPASAVAPVCDGAMDAHGFLVAVLQGCLRQVLAHASEIAAGAADGRFVHQLRVGLRRLRTALRELGRQAQGLDTAHVASLQRAFQALGTHRDAQAVLPALRREMAAAGLKCADEAPASGAGASPQAIVQDPAFQCALLAVLAFCHAAPPLPEKNGTRRLRAQVARRLGRLHARIARDAASFAELSAARQHGVRKRVKRLRYLAEFAAPLFDGPRAQRYLQHWREAQDALGDSNDLRVGLAALRAQRGGARPPRAEVRWMDERLTACVKRCRRALRRAVKRRVFWAG